MNVSVSRLMRVARDGPKDFSERLLHRRNSLRMTQAVLAEKSNISNSFISELENGHANPSITVVLKIAKVLKTMPGWLAFGEGERK